MNKCYIPYTWYDHNIIENVPNYISFFLVCTWVKLNLKIIIFQITDNQQPIINQYIL